MNDPALKLTLHFGERDRCDGHFLADEVLDIFAGEGIAAGILLRGVEGFGIKHRLRTDRLLTLSEDLPLMAIAVDRTERIERAFERIEPLLGAGLLTMERARLLSEPPSEGELAELGAAAKLTIYMGRDLRVDGRPAHELAVDSLYRCGVDGATVLLGVDGTVRGTRRRATFFGRNQSVPAMIVSVGAAADLAAAARRLGELPGQPLMTLERVHVIRRDGRPVGSLPEIGEDEGPAWQRLSLFASEQAHVGSRPVHVEAIRRLRGHGAAGATALRGIWGYDGRHGPHGEDFWSLRRRVPTLTALVDEPPAVRRWLPLLEELTPHRGLIISERVPAFRAKGPGIAAGRLAVPRDG